jgi:REP element-mobilizing transposase RayT
MKKNHPDAYFITFTCYGARLHGDTRGTVDRNHNEHETIVLKSNKYRRTRAKNNMKNKAYTLDIKRRACVLKEIIRTCAHNDWYLIAAHVRSNHVHLIVSCCDAPELVLTQLKLYSSRALNKENPDDRIVEKKWARHGSTRYIWSHRFIEAAVDYVLYRQGRPMAWCCAPDYRELG